MRACLEKFIPPAQLLIPLNKLVDLKLPITRPCILKWLTLIHTFVCLSTALPLPKTLTSLKLHPLFSTQLPILRVGAIPKYLALNLTLIQLLLTIGTLWPMRGITICPLCRRAPPGLPGPTYTVALFTTALGWAAVIIVHPLLFVTQQCRQHSPFRRLPKIILLLDRVARVPGL